MHPRYGRRLPLTHDQGLLLARASYLVPTITILVAMSLHALAGPPYRSSSRKPISQAWTVRCSPLV